MDKTWRRSLALPLALALVATACTGGGNRTSSGALEIVVGSDMSIPKDLDHLTLKVTQEGRALLDVDADLGADALRIPATFKVKGTGDPTSVKIQGVGYQNGEPRVERDAITPIPTNRVGELRLTLNYLCVGTAKVGDDGQVHSTCPDGKTCVQGACVTAKVPASSVPTYVPMDGGVETADGSVSGGCFDVATCFAGANPVDVDPDTCSLALPAGVDPERVNVALEYPVGSGGGVCDGSKCWVVFNSGKDFTASSTVVTLPPGACTSDAAQGGTWVLTTTCLPKTDSTPECGDYSSVQRPVNEPVNPVAPACAGPSTQSCGLCGVQKRTCTSGGVWSDWSSCSGEGSCQPGMTRSCGASGTQTCNSSCQWGACGCAAEQLACGANGDCSSPTDPATCGDCGQDCTSLPNVSAKGLACKAGKCSYQCASGFADCGDAADGCATDLSDLAHCGSCDNDCTHLPHVIGSTSCNDGACILPAKACADGFADCNGDATDGCETDVTTGAHCGSCDNVCSGAKPLCDTTGTCTASCAANTTACDQKCADTATDENNCGSCGHVCSSDQTCVAGKCGGVCGPTGLNCNGQQPQSCGPDGQWKDLGAACANNQTCVAGRCTGMCGPTQTDKQSCGTCSKGTQTRSCNSDGTWGAWSVCSGGATLQTDNTNCGACGNACANGVACQAGTCSCSGPTQQACGTCNGGTQSRSCNVDGTWSAWSACTGGANLQTDSANCGSCGMACGAGVSCQAGKCACAGPSSQTCGNCGTQTRTCDARGTWSAWSSCTGTGACAPGATQACDGTGMQTCTNTCQWAGCVCPTGLSVCGNSCVDELTDNANCGKCGGTCSGALTCQSGTCGCTSGLSPCGNSCVNEKTDNANCGKCGGTCGGALTCQNGTCGCTNGLTQCGTSCIDVTTDNANCGKCGVTCTGTTTCQNGTCSCPANQHLCNGACVDSTSTSTCGTSCSPCPTPTNGTATCDGTQCGANCNSGLTACGSSCDVTSEACGHCGTQTRTCTNNAWSAWSACGGETATPPGGAAGGGYDFDDGSIDGWTLTGPVDSSSGSSVGSALSGFPVWDDSTNFPSAQFADPADGKGAAMVFAGQGWSAPSGYWRMDFTSPPLADTSPFQNHHNVSFQFFDHTMLQDMEIQVLFQVQKCDGSTSYWRQVDSGGNPVFCVPTTSSGWTSCQAQITIGSISRVTNLILRVFGKGTGPSEEEAWIDQIHAQ